MPQGGAGGRTPRSGGVYGVKRFGGDFHREVAASKLYKQNKEQVERAFVNIADDWNEGKVTEFEVREFMKRLGKNKYGGILHFKAILPKKFVKYLPKKAKTYVCVSDPNLYAAEM